MINKMPGLERKGRFILPGGSWKGEGKIQQLAKEEWTFAVEGRGRTFHSEGTGHVKRCRNK
jgi:hypothetical protein